VDCKECNVKIPSREIPQADSLDTLERAINAVANGAKTFQQIATTLGYGERQGRYYRLAGELLGLLEKPAENYSRITSLGKSFIGARGKRKAEILAVALMNSRLFQRTISFLQSTGGRGATRTDLKGFVATLTETTPNMVERRVSTIVSWLRSAGLVTHENNRYVLGSLPPTIQIVNYPEVDEPLRVLSARLKKNRIL